MKKKLFEETPSNLKKSEEKLTISLLNKKKKINF